MESNQSYQKTPEDDIDFFKLQDLKKVQFLNTCLQNSSDDIYIHLDRSSENTSN